MGSKNIFKKIDKSMGKVRWSTASYKQINNSPICDTIELAEIYSENIGNIPERIGFTKACEIHLLARGYLRLLKELKVK